MITAKIIEDSISEAGDRLTTLQLVYPRFIHAEMLTHRVFSRNASSSRAIPVAKMIRMVREEPAMPIHWGKNRPGMQAVEELTGDELEEAKSLWMRAATCAANAADLMNKLGVHKQVANRILEPFQHISVVVTGTEWDNFFSLRAHPDAQPEIQALAFEMLHAFKGSVPKVLVPGDWHLPYVADEDWAVIKAAYPSDAEKQIELAKKISAARCCRVSYLKHDGERATVEEELALCDRLAGARPIHASPFEHQATPDVLTPSSRGKMAVWKNPGLHGNLHGWIQYRKQIEASFNS